jgi:uncharacterized LabA/DUF88 family protein
VALVPTILFVDGENLTIRYQALLKEGRVAKPSVVHIPDVYVWQPDLSSSGIIGTDVLRINYYTSLVGDDGLLAETEARIAGQRYRGHGDLYKGCQIYPRVYKKPARSNKSRLVDINITIDVMRHCYGRGIDVIWLFSGDGDFVALVEEAARSGTKVGVAAFSSGLEKRLSRTADDFFSLDELYFQPVGAQAAQ